MIVMGVKPDTQAKSLERRSKALRCPDSRNRMYRRRSRPLACGATVATGQINETQRLELEWHRLCGIVDRPSAAVNGDQINASQPACRLAQWPSGQTITIAQAPRAVDHRDLNVAMHGVVLKTIIAEHQITFKTLEQIFNRTMSITINHYWATATAGN
jgi:hypothetical protein